jgi:methionyl-tRNA formyltransferase
MRVALAGGGLLGVRLYQAIQDSGDHQVVAVVENGRTRETWAERMAHVITDLFHPSRCAASLARRDRVPVLRIDHMTPAELAPLSKIAPDLLLVGSFSIILKKALLDLPRLGCVNCHPSLLPRHRGPNPYRAVLLSGDRESGVSFHQMTEGIDDGPVYWQASFALSDEDTAGSVYHRACDLAETGVLPLLDALENGTATAMPQDAARATYEPNLSREKLLLDWTRPAADLGRMVRACHPFSPAGFIWNNRLVYAHKALVTEGGAEIAPGTVVATDPAVTVATGGGQLAIIEATADGYRWPEHRRSVRVGERLPLGKESS